nr:hypothetical protein [Tanacetum cinerariifolium]
DSTVTYTTVSSPCEGLSGDVSPGVDGPSVMPEDPYAYVVAAFQALPPPDYVPGPEEPEQAPPSPVYIPYVPKLVYPEYIPPEDDVFPAEEQPLPAPLSRDYVPGPEHVDDEIVTKDQPYIEDASPTAQSPEYDDDMDIEANKEEEEEEHLAPADSIVVALTAADQASSAEETELFKTDESA